ncbi:pentapeptide repeat-containing protein [Actinomadura kijaniata]|uniref:pentapeptide repeat-containing protein n=1 Tax=Actinomadura kijaniata TaxID=46161 RepID=UPI0008325D37|nr:pentapeptide repeat-containing protein [Actinomadura kijaniata]
MIAVSGVPFRLIEPVDRLIGCRSDASLVAGSIRLIVWDVGDGGGSGGSLWRRACLWLGWTGALVVAVAVVTAFLWPAADLIAAHDVRHIPSAERAEKLRVARDAARGRIIQFIVGFAAAAGFVYTVRNFGLARQQSELNRRTLEQSEAVQVADRFARAIDQLGSDAVDVRLGAIYSLERITRDSPRDQPAVVDVLAAFVCRSSLARLDGEVPQDLQAAVAVLARRQTANDRGRLRLRGARLAGVEMAGAALAGADLAGADLSDADLRGADLAGADLSGAMLQEADLTGAAAAGAVMGGVAARRVVLREADLRGVDLTEAQLPEAQLTGACLVRVVADRVRLTEADLAGADLTGAVLTGGDLTGCVLKKSALTDVRLDDATLTRVDAREAVLVRAHAPRAVLSQARLQQADLSDADLDEVNLSGALLEGARLDGVDLTRVRRSGLALEGAVASAGTRLPSGWRREEATGRIGRRDS